MARTRRRLSAGRPWQPPRRSTSGGPVYNIPISSPYGGLGGAYAGALDSANAANEQRYQQILGGYDALAKRSAGYLKNAGKAERKDIQRRYRAMGSDVYQTLVNRGFANSSLLGTMQQGVQREMTDEQARIAQRVAEQKLAADMAISQGRFGVMERRTDSGPDTNQMLQLAQGAGRYGMGMGGYAGGVPGQMGPFNMLHPLRQAWAQGAAMNLGWGRQGMGGQNMWWRTPAAAERYERGRAWAIRKRSRVPRGSYTMKNWAPSWSSPLPVGGG